DVVALRTEVAARRRRTDVMARIERRVRVAGEAVRPVVPGRANDVVTAIGNGFEVVVAGAQLVVTQEVVDVETTRLGFVAAGVVVRRAELLRVGDGRERRRNHAGR